MKEKKVDEFFRSLQKNSWSNLSIKKKKLIIESILSQINERATEFNRLSKLEVSSFHDHLFNVFMCQFNAMTPDKKELAIIFRIPSFSSLLLLLIITSSPRFSLPKDLLKKTGLTNHSNIKSKAYLFALIVLCLSSTRVWYKDNSLDQSLTMMHLDQGLKKINFLLTFLP